MSVHGTARWIATAGASFGALAALIGACTSNSTDFPGGEATTTSGAGAGSTGSMAQGTGGSSSSGMNGGAGGTTTTSSANGGAGGGAMVECKANGDCDAKLGAAACGNWLCDMAGHCQISAPNCTDADHDGYGTGAMCMCSGLDCDDGDAKVKDTGQRACYSGPMGSSGKGTCHDGAQSCSKGQWSPCIGEVTPAGEACNNLDDDCNGTPDDNLGTFTCGIGECFNTVNACSGGKLALCVPKNPPSLVDGAGGQNCDGKDNDCDGQVDEDCNLCIHVQPLGNDGTADGSVGKPFKTIQPAVNYAANNNGPKTVCVAGGATCNLTSQYASPAAATVTIPDGISLLGSYEATNWTQCNAITTTIQPQTGAGVTFPNTVKKATLSGFQIDRFAGGTMTAVTVDGAKGVTLSNIVVLNLNNGAPTNTNGVNIINGGDATLTRSRVEAGAGTMEAYAVRTVGSKVSILNNCSNPLDANGRCPAGCGGGAYLRGRSGGNQAVGTGYTVLLDNSPGSKVESSSLCQSFADTAAQIKVQGDGTGVLIRANFVFGFNGNTHSHGVWLEDCMGAKPWITDNFQIFANGNNAGSFADGVRAIGDCHPTIDKNLLIGGGGEGQANQPNGVHCGANGKGASKCIVVGNVGPQGAAGIRGSAAGFPNIATGVRCDGGACLRIEQNVITGRGGQQQTQGIFLQQSGAYVDNNEIRGGCGPTATGITAVDAYARIQNNRIFGYTQQDCNGGANVNLVSSTGIHNTVAAGVNEIDVHSNDIDGTGNNSGGLNCTSRGLDLDIGPNGPAAGKGIYRNNIIRAGVCSMTRQVVRESAGLSDPRIFEHNDLDPFQSPQALYVDEGNMPLTTTAAVDALKDMTVNGTISADCNYLNYPTDLHISATSMCKGGGTATGVPAMDMDSQPRKNPPAIGADEP